MSKRRVQEQFGANAAAYAVSNVHARGSSLERLLALVRPESGWTMLDVATGAGHTALAFAPHVAHAIASDLTPEMLAQASRLAAERGLTNLTVAPADAEVLPFDDDSFDLVTCRIAAHHFPDVDRFLAEAARVLRPGGRLGMVDNIVPGSRRRGKAAEGLRRAGEYINAFEKLRDPSHGRCLSEVEWVDRIVQAGFVILEQEIDAKPIDFHDWAARMQVAPADVLRLEAMLRQAPPPVADFLTPHFAGDRISFQLQELIIVGQLVNG